MNASDKSWVKVSVIGIILGVGLLLFKNEATGLFGLDSSAGIEVAAVLFILGGLAKILGLLSWHRINGK